jgi:uncharacterized protein YlzI (FlbEa/FlbD family)
MKPRWFALRRDDGNFIAVNLDHVAAVKVTPEHVTMHLESGHIFVIENEPQLQERLTTLIQVDGIVLRLDTVSAAILSA